jgi:hypothetical protein
LAFTWEIQGRDDFDILESRVHILSSGIHVYISPLVEFSAFIPWINLKSEQYG